MLVAIGLVSLILVILVRLLPVPVVILFALPPAIIGAFVALAVIGHATNIITGLAVSLQAAVPPVTVIAAGMWFAYSVGGGLYGVALAAAAMLSMAGIVVAVDSYGPKAVVPIHRIEAVLLPQRPERLGQVVGHEAVAGREQGLGGLGDLPAGQVEVQAVDEGQVKLPRQRLEQVGARVLHEGLHALVQVAHEGQRGVGQHLDSTPRECRVRRPVVNVIRPSRSRARHHVLATGPAPTIQSGSRRSLARQRALARRRRRGGLAARCGSLCGSQ
jgi:inorganic H+ pyrophosphatase